jgi:hypothetical protein
MTSSKKIINGFCSFVNRKPGAGSSGVGTENKNNQGEDFHSIRQSAS